MWHQRQRFPSSLCGRTRMICVTRRSGFASAFRNRPGRNFPQPCRDPGPGDKTGPGRALGRFLDDAEHRRTGSSLGLCSFKAEPNSLGEVEIAYYTFPHREGRGIATAMVHELTKRALRRVPLVIAHTLPIGNASCKILRRCGYQRAGEVIDPDHGLVWRWQYPTNASSER